MTKTTSEAVSRAMAEWGRRGGKALAKKMTPQERVERARKGGTAAAENRRKLAEKAAELDRLHAAGRVDINSRMS